MTNKQNARRGGSRRAEKRLHPHYRRNRSGRQPRLNIQAVAVAALRDADRVVAELLPGGRRQGHEYVVTNPKRNDHRAGSFSINLETGRWADFATDDRGGDLVSLVAYLRNQSQIEAARELMYRLGVSA